MELFLFNFFATVLILSAYMVIFTKNSVHAVLYLVLVFCINSCILLLLGTDFLALLFLVVYVGAIAILFLFVVMLLPIKRQQPLTFFQSIPIGIFIGLILCMFVILLIGSEVPEEIKKPLVIHKVKLRFLSDSYINEELDKMADKIAFWGKFTNTSDLTLEAVYLALKKNRPIISIWVPYVVPSEMVNLSNVLKDKETINLFGTHLYGTHFYYTLIAGLILLLALIGAIVLAGKNKKIKNQFAYQQMSRSAKNAILKIKS